ncbi:MAG: hypothetical protein AVDCRST_MAG59-5309 [uncultured Thermomicrobiales bacterium]|uniref:Uncharacterized protein n=1 Tax=uncultured Thermomicrobiales bacterium TaxID=1645740 RepID=A0A6J4VNT3_9BACT|nr:MAG: hypothetical protein AVDCRST_MAG59-5309 [uncultured Thermomicrobiales bacterium]
MGTAPIRRRPLQARPRPARRHHRAGLGQHSFPAFPLFPIPDGREPVRIDGGGSPAVGPGLRRKATLTRLPGGCAGARPGPSRG